MYPTFLLLRPDLAREMLNYRLVHMAEAQKRSQTGGYSGARYDMI